MEDLPLKPLHIRLISLSCSHSKNPNKFPPFYEANLGPICPAFSASLREISLVVFFFTNPHWETKIQWDEDAYMEYTQIPHRKPIPPCEQGLKRVAGTRLITSGDLSILHFPHMSTVSRQISIIRGAAHIPRYGDHGDMEAAIFMGPSL